MPTAYATVAPGIISPRRPVPASIDRPEYVDKPSPVATPAPRSRTPRPSSRCGSPAGSPPRRWRRPPRRIAPGVTTDEIDRVGHEFLLDHGAYPSTLGYRGFPKSLCTSVNEVICHGIPDDRRLHGRRHRQHRHHRLHRRRPRRHRRDLPVRRRRRGVPAAGRAHPRGDDARDQGGPARAADQHHRPGHRELRRAVRLRRGPGLHRARHRHGVPLRPDRSPLRRRAGVRHGDRARHDLHDRAHAQPRHATSGTCGTTAGRSSPRTAGARPSSSTPSSSPRQRQRDPRPCR